MTSFLGDRFSKEKQEKVQTPGPGFYEINRKSEAKQIIVNKGDRFKQRKPSEIPGPGAYEEEVDEWNKKSYNVLFSEVN